MNLIPCGPAGRSSHLKESYRVSLLADGKGCVRMKGGQMQDQGGGPSAKRRLEGVGK